jgi:hypothetical protein
MTSDWLERFHLIKAKYFSVELETLLRTLSAVGMQHDRFKSLDKTGGSHHPKEKQ